MINFLIFLEGSEVLLMAGGFDGDSVLDQVELYSPEGTCNFEITPLPQRLYGLFCFVFKDEIFCCGGDVPWPSKLCYRYLQDERMNGIGEWVIDDEKTMHRPRFFAAVSKIPETGVIIVK